MEKQIAKPIGRLPPAKAVAAMPALAEFDTPAIPSGPAHRLAVIEAEINAALAEPASGGNALRLVSGPGEFQAIIKSGPATIRIDGNRFALEIDQGAAP